MIIYYSNVLYHILSLLHMHPQLAPWRLLQAPRGRSIPFNDETKQPHVNATTNRQRQLNTM